MFPAANVSSVAVKAAQPAPTVTAQKTTQPQAPETARTSSGESAAANIKAETSHAVQAAEQSSVAPRLRDQETAERTDRSMPTKDNPTGPPPTFEESPLERNARVAFDPPEQAPPAETPRASEARDDGQPVEEANKNAAPVSEAPQDPPPTPTEKAEASFTETRSMGEAKDAATVDVRN